MGQARFGRCLLVTVLSGMPLVATGSLAALVPVTACGQSVAGRGVLVADLDCSAFAAPAIVLEKNATLYLQGFTLLAADGGVSCAGLRCNIVGPGTIRRPAVDPMQPWKGISAVKDAKIRDVILENWSVGVSTLGKADVRGSVIRDGRDGLHAWRVKVRESTFSGNQRWGLLAFEGVTPNGAVLFYVPAVRASTFVGNGIDIVAHKRPKLLETTCTTSWVAVYPSPPPAVTSEDAWGVCGG